MGAESDTLSKLSILFAHHRARNGSRDSRYALGQKRCQTCSVFITWPGFWCPCCGNKLRLSPRNIKYKNKLRKERPGIEIIVSYL
jgi:rRNA maturation endonuclease Nob1